MAVSLEDAGYVLYHMYGGQLTREEYRQREAYRRDRERYATRQAARGRLRIAAKLHGKRKAAPRWQRGGHRPRSIESAMSDPRVRGQLATRP